MINNQSTDVEYFFFYSSLGKKKNIWKKKKSFN